MQHIWQLARHGEIQTTNEVWASIVPRREIPFVYNGFSLVCEPLILSSRVVPAALIGVRPPCRDLSEFEEHVHLQCVCVGGSSRLGLHHLPASPYPTSLTCQSYTAPSFLTRQRAWASNRRTIPQLTSVLTPRSPPPLNPTKSRGTTRVDPGQRWFLVEQASCPCHETLAIICIQF